ncbi:MAG TPA: hypothetical protein VFY92_10755 [Hyphomicrobiaceae bacterium]|nr:hypothetical protein [Hyphomicrobiaceae bacterium]
MFLALTLFGEYRKAFMANPLAVMTLELLLAAMHRGGPAILAAVALFGGAMLAASGILLLLFLLLHETAPLWRAIRLGLGL